MGASGLKRKMLTLREYCILPRNKEGIVALTKETVMVYGLKNCDNCRKALKVLRETGFRPELHDVRAVPLTSDEIELFTTWFGAELVNRKSKTWRDLSDIEREKSASTLLTQYPALMKRPLITAVSEQTLGWGAGVQAIWSATRA